MRKLLTYTFLTAFITLNAQVVPDPTFAGTGIVLHDNGDNDNLNCIRIQDDQKIVVAGVSFDFMYAGSLRVLRLLPDGSLDPDLGMRAW